MNFEINGKIIELYQTQEISERFRKREFVLEVEEIRGAMNFTELIKFQTIQDRTAILDSFSIGDNVKVSFGIKGRKWEKDGKISYFTNLEAWRIEAVQTEMAPPQMQPPDDGLMPPPDDQQDDLPF